MKADDLLNYICLSCNIDYSKKIDEELKKRFKKTVKFSNNVLNLHACRNVHDLYLKGDILNLVDVFGIFRKMHLEVYQQDPTNFFQPLD